MSLVIPEMGDVVFRELGHVGVKRTGLAGILPGGFDVPGRAFACLGHVGIVAITPDPAEFTDLGAYLRDTFVLEMDGRACRIRPLQEFMTDGFTSNGGIIKPRLTPAERVRVVAEAERLFQLDPKYDFTARWKSPATNTYRCDGYVLQVYENCGLAGRLVKSEIAGFAECTDCAPVLLTYEATGAYHRFSDISWLTA